jgi:hypothetical protein
MTAKFYLSTINYFQLRNDSQATVTQTFVTSLSSLRLNSYIDFEPKNKYFALPVEEFRELKWEQAQIKIEEMF